MNNTNLSNIEINTFQIDFTVENYELDNYADDDELTSIGGTKGLNNIDTDLFSCNLTGTDEANNKKTIAFSCLAFLNNYFLDNSYSGEYLFSVTINASPRSTIPITESATYKLESSSPVDYRVSGGETLTISATNLDFAYIYTNYGSSVVSNLRCETDNLNLKQLFSLEFNNICSNFSASLSSSIGISKNVSFKQPNDDIQNGLNYNYIAVSTETGKLSRVNKYTGGIELSAWQTPEIIGNKLKGYPITKGGTLFVFDYHNINPVFNVTTYASGVISETPTNLALQLLVITAGNNKFYSLFSPPSGDSLVIYESNDGVAWQPIIGSTITFLATKERPYGSNNTDMSFNYFDEKLWITGGCIYDINTDSATLSNKIWLFDLKNSQTGWATHSIDLPTKLAWHSGVEYDNKLYILGGVTDSTNCEAGDYRNNITDVFNEKIYTINTSDSIQDVGISISASLIKPMLLVNTNDLYILNLHQELSKKEIFKLNSPSTWSSVISDITENATTIVGSDFVPDPNRGFVNGIEKELPVSNAGALFDGSVYISKDLSDIQSNELITIDKY